MKNRIPKDKSIPSARHSNNTMLCAANSFLLVILIWVKSRMTYQPSVQMEQKDEQLHGKSLKELKSKVVEQRKNLRSMSIASPHFSLGIATLYHLEKDFESFKKQCSDYLARIST